MPDALHVCLGRAGDLCIALPALKKWSDQHGKPAPLLTSAEFMPMLEGCSYVKAAEWKGDFSQLPACLAFLKTDLPNVPVKCLQFYQSGEKPALPSFWHEQMYLAGLLGGGEDELLVFDRRDADREWLLCTKTFGKDTRPVILFCGAGHSSPFKDAGLIAALIHQSFPDCLFIDLSAVKAERIYDLLGLYDRAAALISIDTVHLHLSKASKVPVFALARDYPERWHGTPQFERLAWYCRYGQVMERSGELIEALRDTIANKTRLKPKIISNPKLPKGAYNPSIIRHDDMDLISYRVHPNRDWRTEIMIQGLPVRFPYPISTCAHEDMRLFTFKGDLWASYVCARGFKDDPRCVVGYGKLIRTPEFWAIEEHFQPDMPGNDWSGLCKNVVFFQWKEDELCAIWDSNTIVLLNKGGTIHRQWETDHEWPYGEIRGGTSPLPYKGKWLRFFHSRIWPDREKNDWRYHIGALVMEPEPPFNTIAVSKKPIISGDESGDPMIWHWKHGVVFVCGAVEDGDGWTISLGINDAHCALLHVKEEDLNL